MQNKIIFFCYTVLFGIVAAMLWPATASWVGPLGLITVLSAISALVAGVIILKKTGWENFEQLKGKALFTLFALLAVTGLLLGYTRYTATLQQPDTHLGTVTINGKKAVYQQLKPIGESARLLLKTSTPLSRDVKLRLTGLVEVRRPVLDDAGKPSMDEQGRWLFYKETYDQQSDIIHLEASSSSSAIYLLEQPFSEIQSVELIEGEGAGTIRVHRLANHISSFCREGFNTPAVNLLGRISGDPMVYNFKAVLPITPDFIQIRENGTYYAVEGGGVRVTVNPDVQDYGRLAVSDAYGYDIAVRGRLYVPTGRSNPGGFDYRNYLRNHNVFGLMNIRKAYRGPSPVSLIAGPSGELRRGNALVEFSLNIRDHMLGVIKRTMPYPQSAFIGGVTLGLRYGLQSAAFIWSSASEMLTIETEASALEKVSDARIFDDFKASGVNHVLAVSGLHVTIITAMFVGIFTLLRLPKKMYTPILICILVIFAIITGARPSTLRAVIMNSMFLLIWSYMGQSLRASVLFGVPVAAFLILIHNPLMIVDASFTLSFGAILSLALLSQPCFDILSRMKGNVFLAFLLVIIGLTAVGIWHWHLLVSPLFATVAVIASGLLLVLAWWLERQKVRFIGTIGFQHIPSGLAVFIAAQFAIQIGMMIPLSSYYFMRWPFAGAYANLIAIPLIGIVLQLAIISCLSGLVPVIGGLLALFLSATNWLMASLFLWIAHASATAFPYPVVSRPTLRGLAVYYMLLAGFIWHRDVWYRLSALCERRGLRRPHVPVAVCIALFLTVLTPLWLGVEKETTPFRVTVLSIGYGSSILIESPGGKKILVDAGYVQYDRGRRNPAERDILPLLSSRRIRRLDGVILTSPRPERAAGISRILHHCYVDHLFVPPAIQGAGRDMTFDQFTAHLGVTGSEDYGEALLYAMYTEVVGNPQYPRRPSLLKERYSHRDNAVNRLAGWAMQTHALQAGKQLFKEDGPVPFYIEVLSPSPAPFESFTLDNQSAVLRVVYGEFAMLLTSDLHYEGQQRLAGLLPANRLDADVMVVPHRGIAEPDVSYGYGEEAMTVALQRHVQPLVEKVDPDWAIFEWGNPGMVLGRSARDAVDRFSYTHRFFEQLLGRDRVLNTDRDQALVITSDGREVGVHTVAAEGAGLSGGVDSIEVGF